jgi:hypothetical protein
MVTLGTLLGLVMAGGAVWFVAEAFAKRRQSEHFPALKAQLRLAESRMFQFRDQAAKLSQDVQILRRNLDDEREVRASAATEYHHSYRKGVLVSGTACLLAGFVFGGALLGLWVKNVTESQSRHKLMNLEVIARVAEMNAGRFKEQIGELKSEMHVLRLKLDAARVAKTVAITKLEILLENLVVNKWGRGYSLNPQKLSDAMPESQKVQAVSKSSQFIPPQVSAF